MSQRRLRPTQTFVAPRVAGVFVAALVSTGCAASSPAIGSPGPGRVNFGAASQQYELEWTRDRAGTRHTVEASAEALWVHLPDVFAELGLGGSVMDADAHIFGLSRPQVAPRRIAKEPLSRFFSCGSGSTGPRADSYELRLLAVTEVRAGSPGISEVASWIEATARPRGTSANPIACSSTGRLERLIVDGLQERARGEGGGTNR